MSEVQSILMLGHFVSSVISWVFKSKVYMYDIHGKYVFVRNRIIYSANLFAGPMVDFAVWLLVRIANVKIINI